MRNLARQLVAALAYLHGRGVLHRDLKPENVLLGRDGRAKLADFGFARLAEDCPPLTSYISTRWYRAPELMLKLPRYDGAVDVFALGCVLVG